MFGYRLYNLLLILLIMASGVAAQRRHLRFERIGTEQGLSQSNVICQLEDTRGFMWFGTRDGLNRYDGYRFTVFKNDPGDPHSIGDNFIRALLETKSGDIWVATRGGVSRFNRTTESFTRYRRDPANPNSLSNDFATSLFEDSRGNIWIGTEDGLNVFNPHTQRFTRYMHLADDQRSLSDGYVRHVFEDSRGNLWAGTFRGGLNLLNRTTGAFMHFQHEETDSRSISNNNVYTIFEDGKGRLWVGTNGGGLEWFDTQNWVFHHYKHSESDKNTVGSNSIYAISEDAAGYLWIGTENGGLNIFDPASGQFATYRNEAGDVTSLSNNSVYSIYRDRRDNMWIGTFNGGINLFNAATRRIAHYRKVLAENSISDNNVLSIYEDSRHLIWVGTDGGGLNVFDPARETFTTYRHDAANPSSICGDYVLTVCEDAEGNIWAGTWGEGISVFNRSTGKFTHFKNEPGHAGSLSNNNVWKIYRGEDGQIWAGTYGGGLNRFNPADRSFYVYANEANNPQSISGNTIQSIYEDRNGELWITTDGAGLNRFDRRKGIFTRYQHTEGRNSIASNSTGSLLQDRLGNLWIGTFAGLSCLNPARTSFTNYTSADGLPNDVIAGLLEDEKGRIWVSTNNGVASFDPRKKTWTTYSARDGLQSNEFKQQAYCKGTDGSFYFGGVNGFNRFSPDSLGGAAFDPPLRITGFQIFNRDLPISRDTLKSPLQQSILETRKLTISYQQSVITFEFASLNYTATDHRQYAYMLEGFDTKWNEVGERRSATYTNLDPGTYQFKVKGRKSNGEWSEQLATLELEITPPFWLTWWFRVLVTVFVAGFLFAFFRYRIKAVTRQKEKLEAQVQERTAEVVRQNAQLKQHMDELAVLKEDLEREKYYLDSLMDNLPVSIYFKDREGRYVRVSKYMVGKYFSNQPGASVRDILGKTELELQGPVVGRRIQEEEEAILRSGEPKMDYLESETDRDGLQHWMMTSKLPLTNQQGKVVGTFGVSRDITKVKTLEKQQHEAQLEKAVAQGKFEIASDVMHDIGNAVVAFGSYLTRIRRLQSEDVPENLLNLAAFFSKNQEALSAAFSPDKAEALIKLLESMAATQRRNHDEVDGCVQEQLTMVSHIQEILDIQRQYITGRESQERKPVDFRIVIQDCLAMLGSVAEKSLISFTTNFADDIPLIRGDRTKLMQLMLNIIKNSMDALAKKPGNREIAVTVKPCDNCLYIEVRDNGHGFEPVTSEQVFKKGFTTRPNGSGLGLYNSKIIADSHDGKIELHSDGPGQGATTIVRLKLS